jgi:flagellar motor switch protein FliN/FliY
MPDEKTLLNGADQGALGAARLSDSAVVLADAVTLNLEVFVGEAKMSLSRFNTLGSGSVITLDAGLNTPVDVRLNGVRVAEGELVAVGDQFGVRITRISH